MASVERTKNNTIKVKGKKAGMATVTIRIHLKNVKKATVLTLKVTVRDKTAGTDTQPSATPGDNPQQTILPTGVTGTTPPAGTVAPAGDSGGTTTPPTGGAGTPSTEGTVTTPSQNPSGTIDMTDSGLYDEDGTLIKSWSELLEAGDIVVVNDEITNCDTDLAGVLKIAAYVTSIGEGAFYGCSNLTGITIPEGVASIGDQAFCACSSLTDLTISDSVTSIGFGAFSGCSSLTDLTIPDGVTSIGESAFSGVPHITYHGIATGSPWGAESMN